MLLTFSKEQFQYKTEAGIKIHTLRKDPRGRWKPGMKIHMWLHNPRNVSKHPFCFDQGKKVVSIQKVRLLSKERMVLIGRGTYHTMLDQESWQIMPMLDQELAINDGFESTASFWAWFKEDFEGVIIHWTDKRY